MNSHECNSNSSDEWHQNLLEGCNDIADRLTYVVNILNADHPADLQVSRRLRVVGQSKEALVSATTCGFR